MIRVQPAVWVLAVSLTYLLTPNRLAAAQVETLDFVTATGAITISATGDQVTVGEQQFRLSDVQRLTFDAAPLPRPNDALTSQRDAQVPRHVNGQRNRWRGRAVVESASGETAGTDAQAIPQPTEDGIFLTDGSWVPGTFTAGEQPDQIAINGPWGNFSFALSSVRALGMRPDDQASDDCIVLAGGQVRGQVSGLKNGALLFTSALTPDPIPLAKVISLSMATGKKLPKATWLWHQARSDRPAMVVRQRASGWAPALALTGALPDLPWVQVEGPRRQYLSDLNPANVEEPGAFGVVWPWQKDRDLDGNPLFLSGMLSARGLSVHSAATMAWSVKKQYTRLQTRIGIADRVGGEGDCVVVITGDGKTLWRGRLRGGQTATYLHLDLSTVSTLTLAVELGERYDIGDHVVLADAVLIKPAKR